MSWTELSEEELSHVSYPNRASGVVIRRVPGVPRIVVHKQAAVGKRVIYLRVDDDLHARAKKLVVGAVSTAIIALVEERFDQVEAGSEEWQIVESGRPK